MRIMGIGGALITNLLGLKIQLLVMNDAINNKQDKVEANEYIDNEILSAIAESNAYTDSELFSSKANTKQYIASELGLSFCS